MTGTVATAPSLAPRDDFPLLSDVTYLNSGSFGLVPRTAQAKITALEERLATEGGWTVEQDDPFALFEGTRDQAALLFGAAPADIAITCGATEALSQIAWALRPHEGENVVSLDVEFPSVTYPWHRVAAETGCEVRLIDAQSRPADMSIDDVAEAVDDRTAVICVSHVQYATGHLLDPAKLVELAAGAGARLVLDMTQSAGIVPFKVDSAEPDFIVAGGYKWLCGPSGAGLCYISPRVREEMVPPFVSWTGTTAAAEFSNAELELSPDARRIEYSVRSYASGVGLGEVMRYFLDLGIDRIRDHSHRLGDAFIEGLAPLNAVLITPTDHAERGGIVNARFPGVDHLELADSLNKAGIIVAPRLGGIRFSFHLFNDGTDVERALRSLHGLLEAARGK